MAGMGMFCLDTQHNLSKLSRARKWNARREIVVDGVKSTDVRRNEDLSQDVVDRVVTIFAEDHFKVLGGAFAIAAPFVAYKFAQHDHLKVSQRAMHARVTFQGVAISIVLSVALLNYAARRWKSDRERTKGAS